MDEFEKWVLACIEEGETHPYADTIDVLEWAKIVLNKYRAFKAKAVEATAEVKYMAPICEDCTPYKGKCAICGSEVGDMRPTAEASLVDKIPKREMLLCECATCPQGYRLSNCPHMQCPFYPAGDICNPSVGFDDGGKDGYCAYTLAFRGKNREEAEQHMVDWFNQHYRPASPAVEELVRELREWAKMEPCLGVWVKEKIQMSAFAWWSTFDEILAKYDKGGK